MAEEEVGIGEVRGGGFCDGKGDGGKESNRGGRNEAKEVAVLLAGLKRAHEASREQRKWKRNKVKEGMYHGTASKMD